jgi:hypothetical protein
VEIATGKVTEYAWDYRNRLSSVVFKDAAGNVVKSIEYTKAGLPTQGKMRYIPPKNWKGGTELPRTKTGGYIDKFGNAWEAGTTRTKVENIEWDVQPGKNMSPYLKPYSHGGTHINVSKKGKIIY